MVENSQTVLLGKGVDAEGQVVEVIGQRFNRQSQTGVADSIRAVLGAQLLRVPTYLQGEGRVAAVQIAQAEGDVQLALKDPIWNIFGDSYAERLTLLDKEGVLGSKGQLYAVSTQNAAFFSNEHQRIRTAVLERTLVNAVLQLTQPEANKILEAVKDGNPLAVFKEHGWIKSEGNPLYVFRGNNGFQEFNEASNQEGFLATMPAYVLVQPAEEARKVSSGCYAISQQRRNRNLIFDFGGKKQLEKVMDATEALGYTKFGSYHDGYTTENGGRLVLLYYLNNGVNGNYDSLYTDGGSLGVAPEALVARAKIVAPVPVKPKALEITVAEEAQ